MSKLLAALGLSTALMASAALPLADGAQAAMAYGGLGADVQQRQIAPIEKAQFFWGGNNYCWYRRRLAWPRLVLVRLRLESGFGWGGGSGWHHWHRGGPVGAPAGRPWGPGHRVGAPIRGFGGPHPGKLRPAGGKPPIPPGN